MGKACQESEHWYHGWEGEIKRLLLGKLRQRGYVLEKDQITFRQTGKDSALVKKLKREATG